MTGTKATTIVHLVALAGLLFLSGNQLQTTTNTTTTTRQPPRLTNLAKEGDILHVRSELTIQPNRDNTHGLVGAFGILDEWLQPGDFYRIKSTGLDENFDYLMYLQTDEFFDLSTQWRCVSEPPSQRQQSRGHLNWISSNLLASKANISFYGALSLWLLGTEQLEPRPMQSQQGVSELSLVPINSTGHLSERGQQQQQQQWIVEDPDNRQYPWFKLHFNSFNEFGSQELELDRVETTNWQVSGSSVKAQLITSSVINYKITRKRFRTLGDAEIFHIPIGFGCRRNQRARDSFRFDSVDRTVFGRLVPFEFDYTAVLELLLSPTSDSTQPPIRPVDLFHSGWFGKTPESLFGFALQVNVQRRHHLNGTTESWREVEIHDGYSAGAVQRRTLEQTSGVCSIGPSGGLEPIVPGELFSLSFEHLEPIGFNEELIELDNDGYEFERLQTVKLEEDPLAGPRQMIVYESRRPNISLNGHLTGEGSIVRTFIRSPETRSRRNYTFHDGLKIDVFIVDKAKLTVQIDNLRASDGADIVRQAKVSECHEDQAAVATDNRWFARGSRFWGPRRSRTFELQFEPSGGQTIGWLDFEMQRDKIETWLYRRLLLSPGEVPVMQLGSEPMQLDFRRPDSALLVKFRLLEPLAAVHYYEQLEAMSLRQGAALRLHERLVGSVYDCSDLCEYEQLGDCLAFSYCQNHLCKTVDSLGLNYEETTVSKPLLELLEPHLEPDQEDACSLYYAPGARLRPKYVDQIVAELRGHLQQEAAASGVANEEAEAGLLSFYVNRVADQLGGDKVQFVARDLREHLHLHETSTRRANNKFKNTAQTGDIDSTYAILRPNYELLAQGIKVEPSLRVVSKLVQTDDQAECLRLCSLNRCQLVSYCSSSGSGSNQQGGLCSMASNVTDWSEYHELSTSAQLGRQRTQQMDGWSRCTLFSEDFLARGQYSYFANTQEPKRHSGSLIRATTATNLVECAAMCELYHRDRASAAEDCLSFDYCTRAEEAVETVVENYCYLHRLHLIMDDFDESIFQDGRKQPHKQEADEDYKADATRRPKRCSHYSKSLLADFKVIENKRFGSHETITYSNVRLDNCALICRRTDTCLAMEFCRANKLTVLQDTCYIRHNNNNSNNSSTMVENTEEAAASDELKLEELLEDSSDCNVYQLKSMIEEEFSFDGQGGGLSLVANLTLKLQEQAADGQAADGPHWTMVIMMIATSFLLGILVRSLVVVGLQTSLLMTQSS